MRSSRPQSFQSVRPARLPRLDSVVVFAIAAWLGATSAAQAQRLLGIDVSAWQGNLSTTTWETFKCPTTQSVGGVPGDGRDFVFIRSSRGGTTGEDHRAGGYPANDNDFFSFSQRYDDPYFVQNINRATNAGLFAGPYHFARADILAATLNYDGTTAGTDNSGVDEADHMLQMAKPWMRPGYLLPVLDLEAGNTQRSTTALSNFVIAFSDRIYQQMGVRPIIYINSSYANDEVNAAVAATFPVLWIARPSSSDPLTTEPPPALPAYPNVYGKWNPAYPTIPTPQPWEFWQYNSGPGLNGYSGNIDKNAANGGMEFLKDHLVPALWTSSANGQWSTLANWNSGQIPTSPTTGPGQLTPVGTQTLPAPRLPGANDTVLLDRASEDITVTLTSGAHSIRKLYVRETLAISAGSLTVGYVPTADSTPISGQFSGPVTLSGTGSLSIHTLQVDPAQTFTVSGGTLTFNSINLMPSATTPAKLLVSGNPVFSGLGSAPATIANGTGSGSGGFVDLGGSARTLNITNVASGTDLSINVPVTNGGITKTGTGTLALNAANTYTGSTTIQAGRIELGGSLNGSVLMSGGVLAFGATTGIRAVNGGLVMTSAATLRVRLNGPTAGTEYDRINLTHAGAAANLAGTLEIIAAPGLAAGTTFRIIDNSGNANAVSGTFAGLPQNAEFYEDGQWWRISYTGGSGNDVVLTRINPTPFQSWQLANFPADVNNPAVVGDLVDTEKDGVINLLEYTFGTSPTVATQIPLTQSSIAGGKLAITFSRVVANTDATITVQGADSPAGPWTDLATSANGGVTTATAAGVVVSETGSGATRTVEVRDLYLTSDPLHPARTLRVQVTR